MKTFRLKCNVTLRANDLEHAFEVLAFQMAHAMDSTTREAHDGMPSVFYDEHGNHVMSGDFLLQAEDGNHETP